MGWYNNLAKIGEHNAASTYRLDAIQVSLGIIQKTEHSFRS